MALQKTIALPDGDSGNYIKVGPYDWDPVMRECSAKLLLYTNQAAATGAPNRPKCVIAKLRLFGPKFDAYLSNAALNPKMATAVGQIYAAAKAEPLIAGGGLNSINLSDATDV